MVTNRNNNSLENNEKITLNKDDDIGGSQIPVMWRCISITISLAKHVHLCKIYVCIPLLFTSVSCYCMHCNEKLLCHHPCSMQFAMNFESIVIPPPDNYRFLNFVPSVINLYTFR